MNNKEELKYKTILMKKLIRASKVEKLKGLIFSIDCFQLLMENWFGQSFLNFVCTNENFLEFLFYSISPTARIWLSPLMNGNSTYLYPSVYSTPGRFPIWTCIAILEHSSLLASHEWHNSKLRGCRKAPNPLMPKYDKSTTASDIWNFAYLFYTLQVSRCLFTFWISTFQEVRDVTRKKL